MLLVMEIIANLPVMLFKSQRQWETWMGRHTVDAAGCWVKIAKKNSGCISISYAEALESALCHGWIDGQKLGYDDKYFLQKFTPRRAKSIWSKINVEKATQLTAAGKMEVAGLAAIEAAKLNGRWDAAYESSSTAEVPTDFEKQLNKNPKAKKFFETLNKTNRYAIYFHIQTAKRPETRQARIDKFITMLSEGKKLY